MQADQIPELFGLAGRKVNRDTCLANLITGVPSILADPDAMRRLGSLVSHVQRIGKGLPEECSSALWALAYKCPEVFAIDVRRPSLDLLPAS